MVKLALCSLRKSFIASLVSSTFTAKNHESLLAIWTVVQIFHDETIPYGPHRTPRSRAARRVAFEFGGQLAFKAKGCEIEMRPRPRKFSSCERGSGANAQRQGAGNNDFLMVTYSWNFLVSCRVLSVMMPIGAI